MPDCPSREVLHVLWSDILADVVGRGVSGDVLVWRDLGAYAPTPADDTIMADMHARILVDGGHFETIEAALEAHARRDQRLASFQQYGEVVFWYDPCLYDHIILVQLLAWFARQNLQGTKLSMVCVRDNLGHNSPEELAAQLPQRDAVRTPQLELAVKSLAGLSRTDSHSGRGTAHGRYICPPRLGYGFHRPPGAFSFDPGRFGGSRPGNSGRRRRRARRGRVPPRPWRHPRHRPVDGKTGAEI